MLISTAELGGFKGLNLQQNPLNIQPNEPIRSVNVDSYEFGGLKKRAGYTTLLGTADGAEVNSLLDFHRNDSSEFWLYRSSGSALYNSYQGTADWTLSTNGTITNPSHLNSAVLEDTFVVVGGGTTRHTTNGGTFTDTTSAPVAVDVIEYQQRIWAAGTSSNLFYSTTGTATDWTTDSSSINIPGAGKLLNCFKTQDVLVATKNSDLIFYYDGASLIDTTTTLAPSSPSSIGQIEGIRFGINRSGIFSYGAGKPQLISNKIQKQ